MSGKSEKAALRRRASRLRRAILVVLAVIAASAAAVVVHTFFAYTERSRYGDEAIAAAILAGVSSVLFAVAGRKLLGIAVAILFGGALVAKPLLFPMISFHTEEVYRLTSETHLNFLVPGGLLLAAAVVLILTLRVGTASRRSS